MSGRKTPEKQEVKQEKPVVLKFALLKTAVIPVCNYASPFLYMDGRLLDCAAIDPKTPAWITLDGLKNHLIAVNYSHDTQQLVALSSANGTSESRFQSLCVWDEKTLNSSEKEKKPCVTFDLQLLEKDPVGPNLKTLYMPSPQQGIFVCDPDVCLIDFEKKTSTRHPMKQQDIIASAMVERRYLALVLREIYQRKSGELSYDQEVIEDQKADIAKQKTFIALYDIEQKNCLDKPVVKYDIENITDLQILPGGHIWVITTDRIVNPKDRPRRSTEEDPHYVAVCEFKNPKEPLRKIDSFTYDHQSRFTVVGNKIFYCDSVETLYSLHSYDPLTGKKEFIANSYFSPHALFSTTQGLCNFTSRAQSSLAFYPSTLEVSERELASHIAKSTPLLPPGVIAIAAGYIGGRSFLAHPDFKSPARPHPSKKIKDQILNRIDQFISEIEKEKDPKKLLLDDLIKLRGLIAENTSNKFSACIEECKHLNTLKKPLLIATNIQDRLAILMDEIRKLDEFVVFKLKR